MGKQIPQKIGEILGLHVLQ